MDLSKYDSFFHDGMIHTIQHKENKIEVFMESAELLPEWNEDNIILSKRNTISGKLLIQGVKSIKEDKNRILETFEVKSPYDTGTIYTLRINSNISFLEIYWAKYWPEYEESRVFTYEIAAEKVLWENNPTLSDNYWEAVEKGEIN